MQRTDNRIDSKCAPLPRLGDNLNPAVQSWVKNVIVPILVREYLEVQNRKNANQQPMHFLDASTATVRDCVEQLVDNEGGLP